VFKTCIKQRIFADFAGLAPCPNPVAVLFLEMTFELSDQGRHDATE
jgi:ABC-type nickel/cobalt efflux system permease component RcnA